MPEISFAVSLIIAAAALVVGFALAFFIQNGKISSLKSENTIFKTENERLFSENSENKIKLEKLLFENSEKERELAVKKTVLETETFRANEAERKAEELSEKVSVLSERLSNVSAKAAATEESNKNIREWIDKAETGLKDSFASISKNITENNNKVFLETANDKVG